MISFDSSGTPFKRSISDVPRLHHTVGLMAPKSFQATTLVLALAGGEGQTAIPISSVCATLRYCYVYPDLHLADRLQVNYWRVDTNGTSTPTSFNTHAMLVPRSRMGGGCGTRSCLYISGLECAASLISCMSF